MTFTETIEFELETHGEKSLFMGSHSISIDVTFSVYSENYGADADGNRGEMREFVDCDDVGKIELTRYSNKQKKNISRVLDYNKMSKVHQALIDPEVDTYQPCIPEEPDEEDDADARNEAERDDPHEPDPNDGM